jgi:hypothetical protein
MKDKKGKVKKKFRRRRKSPISLKIERDNKMNKRKYTRKYLRLRNFILLRDNYTCQFWNCERPTGVKLSVHHIVKFASSKLLRQNKFNLVAICNTCAREHINGREKKFEARFKSIARRNYVIYKRDKKTKDEILEERKKYQQLPDGFVGYKYKSDDDITAEKKEEYYLRKTWRLIKFRTQNKTSNSYKNYGARGIKMYGAWIEDYEAFSKYILDTLGERPEDASIDRIDNDKGYEPGNIRWATASEQGQNRRTTVLDEEMVAVILILFYKCKFRHTDIVNKLNLPNRTLSSSVVLGKTWTNISYKYISIINNQEVVDRIKEKVENGKNKNNS